MKRVSGILGIVAAGILALGAGPVGTVVVCAPGYPGNTEQAQPTMDEFAAALARAAGWPEGSLRAEYSERADAGVERIRSGDAVLALVTLPFYLEFGSDLELRPHLQAVRERGAVESWSLVVQEGTVRSPGDLSGWEVTGVPGYSPRYVRGPVLGGWGDLPGDVEVTSTSRALSALRRASRGEKVAVLLDDVQAAALASLPFGGSLEIVARSGPLPASVLCTVGDGLVSGNGELLEALAGLHRTEYGAVAMEAMELRRFEMLDPERLEEVVTAFEGAAVP
jgi:hypothetical protein